MPFWVSLEAKEEKFGDVFPPMFSGSEVSTLRVSQLITCQSRMRMTEFGSMVPATTF